MPSDPASLWHLNLLTPWKTLRTHPSNPAQGLNHINAFFLNEEMGTWLHTKEPKTLMLCFQVSSLACKSVFRTHSGRKVIPGQELRYIHLCLGLNCLQVFQAPPMVLQNREPFLSWFHLDRAYLRSTKVMGHTLCKGAFSHPAVYWHRQSF